VIVAGTGTGRYFVADAAGKNLTNASTNTPVELPAGAYTITLNGTTQRITVRPGETSTATAGGALVAGTGQGRYFVRDAAGNNLTNESTNVPVELFPGSYTVALNGTTEPIVVREKEVATVTAGRALVTASTKGRYFVSDATDNNLTNENTDTAVELFAGSYTASLNDAKQPFSVRAGEQTVVRVK
jgi:hypothetical protein